MNNRINRNASPALTFLFSLLPGAGHMYLGLMRRGLEIMVVFFAAIFLVANTLGLAEIGVPLSIILFFYSLFDAQHLYKAVRKGEEVADTDFLKISSFTLNGYHMGIGAILLGFIFLLDRLRPHIVQFMQPAVYSMMERSITPLLLIALGLYLVKRAGKGESDDKNGNGNNDPGKERNANKEDTDKKDTDKKDADKKDAGKAENTNENGRPNE